MLPQQAQPQSSPVRRDLLTEDQLCDWVRQFDVSGTESKLIWGRMYRQNCSDPNKCIDRIHSASLQAIQSPCSFNGKLMATSLLKKLLFGQNNVELISDKSLKTAIKQRVSDRAEDIIRTANDHNQWRIQCFEKLVELAGYKFLLNPQVELPKSPEELQQWAGSLDISSQHLLDWKDRIGKSKKFSRGITEGLLAIKTPTQKDQEMAKAVLRKLFSVIDHDPNDIALGFFLQTALNEGQDTWEFQTLVRLSQIAYVGIIPLHIQTCKWFNPLQTT